MDLAGRPETTIHDWTGRTQDSTSGTDDLDPIAVVNQDLDFRIQIFTQSRLQLFKNK